MVTPMKSEVSGEARIVLVAAIASGQGKTTATAALARKLLRQGQRVRVFKCGPDFIDPMLLERASGAPVQTLDLWLLGEHGCRAQLAHAAAEADVVLVEGVMGLYDGTPSAAELAQRFGIPVVVVIDAAAMAQTAGALLMGLRDYGPVELAGVIANGVASRGHAELIAQSMRGIPLLATLARQPVSLPERHLGLVLPAEVSGLETLLDRLADTLVLDEAAWRQVRGTQIAAPSPAPLADPVLRGRTIAVARDAAFAFLYPANLDTLRQLGATLRFFSPLADQPLPEDADALYLPGGYPELHAETLSQAKTWIASVRTAHAAGLPMVAECGGMMALSEALVDVTGKKWPMAALLPGCVTMQNKLAALGPQSLADGDDALRGHTFHYSTFDTPLAPEAHLLKHPSGLQGEAVYRLGSLSASYFHAYFASNPQRAAALFLPMEAPCTR
jgi:cobyrinic acid a,c-diamide synthase